MIIEVKTKPSYKVVVERGCLSTANEVFDLDRKCLILTDSGVPSKYVEAIASKCREQVTVTIPQGEDSKSIETYMDAMKVLLDNNFTRHDCVIAIGGGVCGDLAGFLASTYMRGIDFYNVPTTLLSMVDSSIGGKTAVNFLGYKNMVGTFYQPRAVLIDPNTLKTLDKRQYNAGLAEAIKMAATFDKNLFHAIELDSIGIDRIIVWAISIKQAVVEKDTKEEGLRKVLNYGHTLGHAYEVLSKGKLLHGEAVSLGMIPMCSEEVRTQLNSVLIKYELPVMGSYKGEDLLEVISHDKKGQGGDMVDAIFVEKLGTYQIRRMSIHELVRLSKEAGI